MIQLYTSKVHPRQWVARIEGSGWVVFPARENGWADRRPARGLDPLHLRQVPLESATNTGILQPEPEFADVA